MKLKKLIDSISSTENLPKPLVAKTLQSLSNKIAEAIDNGENINLPSFTLKVRTLKAKPADGEKPAKSERKSVRLRLKNSKK